MDQIPYQDKIWDLIVIGSGMGGGTLAYEVSRNGKDVLIVDEGRFSIENSRLRTSIQNCDSDLITSGWWPKKISGLIDGTQYKNLLPLGCGSGGSATHYAAQLERFQDSDFSIKKNYKSESTWPIKYSEFESSYRRAEILYRVHGTRDPLALNVVMEDDHLLPPHKITKDEDKFFKQLVKSGLNPYRAHIAAENIAGCDGCPGKICKMNCKNDPSKICIQPALSMYGANFFAECSVKKIIANKQRVEGLECIHLGKKIKLQAKVFALAAGAIHTPAILLNSRSESWPHGVANSSRLVGKNLMWHYTDYFILIPFWIFGGKKTHPKLFSSNRLYTCDGMPMGNLQSAGVHLNKEYIYQFLIKKYQNRSSVFKLLVPTFFLIVLSWIFEKIFSGSFLAASIIEDLPYEENQISVNSDGEPIYTYIISSELRMRANMFYKKLKKLLHFKMLLIRIPQTMNLNMGHPSGTCRFGLDPNKSVIDKNNRSHDLPNLFICDASFFPTSGGTNPSLTIAANALRIAPAVISQIEKESTK